MKKRPNSILRLALIGAGMLVGSLAGAASPKGIDAIYAASSRVEKAALAPDGRHVAFAVRGGRGLEVAIYDTGQPGAKVMVAGNWNSDLQILSWISRDQLLAASGPAAIVVSDVAGKTRTVDTSHLFQSFEGEDGQYAKRPGARIFQAPVDPAVLLFESNVRIPPDAFGGTGIPGRPWVLQVHRLNVLTGESQRLMSYDVKTSLLGMTIVDRQGKPRLVHRQGEEPAFFAYKTKDGPPSAVDMIRNFIGDYDWDDLDGMLKDPNTFSFSMAPDELLTQRTIPLGFDADPSILFFASNLGRDTYGLYAVDLRTGKKTDFAFELPGIDLVELEAPWQNSPLVFDRSRQVLVGVRVRSGEPKTHWLDPELATVQNQVEKEFPGRRVELLEWDEPRERFLMKVGGLQGPERYFVFDRAEDRGLEFFSPGGALAVRDTNPVEAFAFTTSGGVRITGYLTLPRTRGKTDPPLLVSLHDGPWQQVSPDFDRDTQALATLGFAVVKINYRGSTGFGVAHREAIREHLDTVPLDDVLATLDWLRATHRPIDFRKVGVMGEGYGGYLALRALQLHPEVFRAGVAINALTTPLDLWSSLDPRVTPPPMGIGQPLPKAEFRVPGARIDSVQPQRRLALWLVSRQDGLSGISVTAHPEKLTQPVFFLHDPGNRAAPFEAIEALRATLQRQGTSPAWQPITSTFFHATSPERIRTVRRIGEFFTLTLNEFRVKIGEAKEKKD